MKKTVFALVLAASVCLTLLTGCLNGIAQPDDLPKLVPASIQLTQDGAPLAGAAVSLIDTAGNQQWYPGGGSDKSGTIVLYTNGRYKGAPEGKYKVVVTKVETAPSKLGPAPSKDDPKYNEKYNEYMKKAAREKPDTYTLIDKKFSDAKSTTLEVEIKKGSSEVPILDVGKKVKTKM